MRLKLINSVFLSFIFIFGSVFGVKLYINNTAKAKMDEASYKYIKELENNTTQTKIEELNKLYKQSMANEKPTTAPPAGGGSVAINFTNFKQMYSYAIKKYNSAGYIYSRASGSAVISGVANGGVLSINNGLLSMNFVKMKKNKEKMFHFAIAGNLLNMNVQLASTHYTDGTTYEFTFPKQGQKALPSITYINTFDWNMTDIFHLPNENSLNVLNDENIQFYFDTTTNCYVGVIQMPVSKNYNSNFGNLLYRVCNSGVKPIFKSVQIKVVVDKTGTLKRIEFTEDVDLTIKVDVARLVGNIKYSYIEQFDIIDNGFFDIKKPDLSYNN